MLGTILSRVQVHSSEATGSSDSASAGSGSDTGNGNLRRRGEYENPAKEEDDENRTTPVDDLETKF